MGLSRRMFTKEFKRAAVQRLERGSSMGEVARALEVNPNVLHRWRREIRQGPGNVFPGHGKQRWSEGRVAELETIYGEITILIVTDDRRAAPEAGDLGRFEPEGPAGVSRVGPGSYRLCR